MLLRAGDLVRNAFGNSSILHLEREVSMPKTGEFVIYLAADGWRWRVLAANHKVMADSGEAYATKSSARRAVRRFLAVLGVKV